MRKKYILFSIATILLVTACLCPSTNIIPNTVTSTPTIRPTDTESVPQLPFFDDFSSNKYDWPVDFFAGTYIDTTYGYVSGKYQWSLLAHKNGYSIAWPSLPSMSNFTVMVDAQQISGDPDEVDYGLIWRTMDGQRYYSFAISNSLYSVYLYDKSSGWQVLYDWATSSAIMPGEVNRLKVVGSNQTYSFYANDTQLVQLSDDSIPDGRPGLGVDLYNTGDTAVIEFDNFSVTSP